ncbi:PhzF [Bacillus anthracis]|nr:PhzF [Bacillus anthracis]PGR16968.1 PhzF [Bacillus anthracis]
MFNSVSFKVSLFGTEKINMRVEQGYEMKWSSLIHIRAEEKECKNNVRLGEK